MTDDTPPVDLSRFRRVRVTEHVPSGGDGRAATAPLDQFVEDPNNPRTEFDTDGFRSFVEDIRTHGILQPIVVAKASDGRFQVRFGHRRLRAARELGLAAMPYVLQSDERQASDFAQVSENEQREGLTPMDLARFVKRKVDEGMAKKELATALGKDAAEITHFLALADASGFILELYQSGRSRNARTLYELSRLWRSHPDVVERRCKKAVDITPAFALALRHDLEAEKGAKTGPKKAAKKGAIRPDRDIEDARTSAAIAQRTFNFTGRPVSIVSCRMTIRESGGSERELTGDALAQFILAAAENGST